MAHSVPVQRNHRIDQLRGALMLLVIIGHVVIGSVYSQPVRYAIYAFHMPLFIALAGYLINLNWLRSVSVGALSHRYGLRVLVPFLPAVLFFTGTLAVHAYAEQRLSLDWWIGSLVSPYYHLWFIPTLVIWVAGLAIILRIRLPLALVTVIALIASFVWAMVPANELPKWLSVLLSKKIVYFFSFFMLGVVLRRALSEPSSELRERLIVPGMMRALMGVLLVASVLYLVRVGEGASLVRAEAWLALNVALILLSVRWFLLEPPDAAEKRRCPFSIVRICESMGRLSLPIYLWHVAPLFVLKGFDIHQSHPLTYYLVSAVAMVLLIVLVIRFEGRSTSLDRWVYGVAPTKAR